MPLPWKKVRASRISRFMADLQSPNRGNSSLVVETGFPTSLVDLFVKNRDRLKKPSSKKKKKMQQRQQFQVEEPIFIPDPVYQSNTRDLEVPPMSSSTDGQIRTLENLVEQQRGSPERGNDRLVSENNQKSSGFYHPKVVEDCVSIVDDKNNNININFNNSKEKCVLVGMLKIFVVVILALSTTKLAVGITLSAFALIFLEYVGKYVLGFIRPCSNALMVLEPLFQKWCSSFPMRSGTIISEQVKKKNCLEEDVCVSGSSGLVESLEFDLRFEEIQVMEPNLTTAALIQDDGRWPEIDLDLLSGDKRLECLEQEVKVRAMEVDESRYGSSKLNKETSRRARIKTKIKKLVPKKLLGTHGKKGSGSKEMLDDRDLDISSKVSSCLGEDKVGCVPEMDEQENAGKVLVEHVLEKDDEECYEGKQKELDCRISTPRIGFQAKPEVIIVAERVRDHRISTPPSVGFQAKQETKAERVRDHRISTPPSVGFQAKQETKAKVIIVEEREGVRGNGSLGYINLFLIALAGLAGGRMLALVITVMSCMMIKFIRRHEMCK